MLRVRRVRTNRPRTAAEAAVTAGEPITEIIRVFRDPVMELTRLFREAANIEHALMVQYLYAAFSLKPRYRELAGDLFDASDTLIGVSIQEMRHLARVNERLVLLGQEPNLAREDFPIRTDLYPFTLELEPLTLDSLAKYVTAEAPAGALDPASAPDEAERAFRLKVQTLLQGDTVRHIGGLYGTIIDRVREVSATHPELIADPNEWVRQLEGIRAQGEAAHFNFFKALFLGTHPVLAAAGDVWADPASAIYPSLPLPKNPTGFEGPGAAENDESRRIAWLSNLHYWLTLGLLHRGHFAVDEALSGRARSHMISCLYPLGQLLASRNAGVPFDGVGMNIGDGVDRNSTRRALRRLVSEIQAWEAELGALLPPEYSRSASVRTAQALEG